MQKTIGGDRLGSGKKMKVNLHGFERSTHDLGYLWRSTMSAGTLIPFMSKVALPGDTFDIELNANVKTLPTIGPLFGSFKLQLDVFQCPMRLYNAMLHNNMLEIGNDMSRVKLPQLRIIANQAPETAENLDNIQTNPSCILSYLGIRGAGLNAETTDKFRDFNAIPLIAYWDIYKNYYANKQEELGWAIHQAIPKDAATITSIDINGATVPTTPPYLNISVDAVSTIEIAYTGTAPNTDNIIFITNRGDISAQTIFAPFTDNPGVALTAVGSKIGNIDIQAWMPRNPNSLVNSTAKATSFNLHNIDKMRKTILKADDDVPLVILQDMTEGEPYIWPIINNTTYFPTALNTQEGLGLKTYQSDLFNNWMQTDWIDGESGINSITAIDTSTGSFTIDTLVLSRKVYNMLNRIAISGGTYDDWLDAVYAHDRYVKCESPMYMGGLSKEVIFQEVVSNSSTETAPTGTEGGNTSQPLGTLAGKGTMAEKHKGGKVIIKVDEPSYIIGIVSLTPRIDYSQGNEWDVNLKTMNDLHKPDLDEIGFQELITEQMAWWDTHWDEGTGKWIQKSAGKQPAWLNYMTSVNKTHGNFAIENNQMFMTLNRRYETDENGSIKDLTTYIDPVKYNFIFAETQIDAQNFWTQIAVDITARRKMSAKIMPNL